MQETISSNTMQNAFTIYTNKENKIVKSSTVSRIIKWCSDQEQYRFLWLAISLFGHIGMVLPLTLLSILFFADNNFNLWIVACSVNVPVLALNLAAQPPTVTLPVMFISLIVNVAIIAFCMILFFA